MVNLKNIIEEVKEYIRREGGEYEDWFVGLADNPLEPIDEAMLFHKVQNHRFMYIETVSSQVANSVADFFINTLGTDGMISKKETNRFCRALYVYKKASQLAGKQNKRFDTGDLLRGVERYFGSAPSVISKQGRGLYASRP